MKTSSRLLVSVLASAGLLSVSGGALAYKFYMTSGAAPQPLRWYTERPAYTWTLSTVEPEETDWAGIQALLETAFDAWIDTACGVVPEFTFAGTTDVTAATPPTSLVDTPDNVVVFIKSRTQWQQSGNQSSWLAITKIANNSVNGEIVDADIEINDGMYTFHYGDDAPPSGQIDFKSMIVHEAGHFFGLDHSLDSSATMYATYAGGDPTEARSLETDDVDGICALYADAPAWVDPNAKPPETGGGDDGGCGAGALGGGLLAGLAGLLFRRRRHG